MCLCAQSLSYVRLLWHHELYPARLVCSWTSPGKNTGVGCHFLFQGTFPTEGLNLCLLCLLHWQAYSSPLCPWEPRQWTNTVVTFLCLDPVIPAPEMCVCTSCSAVLDSLRPHGARQAPLPVEFSRREYWSDRPFPPPGDLQTQGSNPCLLHCRWILYLLRHQKSPCHWNT